MKEYILLENFIISNMSLRERSVTMLNKLAQLGWTATSIYSASARVLLLEREAVEPKKGGR